jgi:hypothetical protein
MAAIRAVREERPADYLKIVAMLVSKCDDSVFAGVTIDAEIEAVIEERRQAALLTIAKMREPDDA